MPFVKGDKNINRQGRPRKAEIDLLRQAIFKEGERKGEDFWKVVAKKAFSNERIMIAVLKKFVPDATIIELQGEGFAPIIQIIKPYAEHPDIKAGNRLSNSEHRILSERT